MEGKLKHALQKAITFLDANDIRYAIIGGIALAHWGVARFTHDVDIKIHVPDVNYDSIRSKLRSAFPELARTEIPQNPLIVAVTIHDVIVDFLLALPGYEELIVERAVRFELEDLRAWVCSAEDLIIQKAIAGRAKDWSDIEALLIEQRGRLDEGYIENWLSQFAEALERPDILSDYHRFQEKMAGLE